MGEGGIEPPTTRPPAEYHTKLDYPPFTEWVLLFNILIKHSFLKRDFFDIVCKE
jgi:hypothetical protein